jgi:hypothetical protein
MTLNETLNKAQAAMAAMSSLFHAQASEERSGWWATFDDCV